MKTGFEEADRKFFGVSRWNPGLALAGGDANPAAWPLENFDSCIRWRPSQSNRSRDVCHGGAALSGPDELGAESLYAPRHCSSDILSLLNRPPCEGDLEVIENEAAPARLPLVTASLSLGPLARVEPMDGNDIEMVISLVIAHRDIQGMIVFLHPHEQTLWKGCGSRALLDDVPLGQYPYSLRSGNAAILCPQQRMVTPRNASGTGCGLQDDHLPHLQGAPRHTH